MKPKRFGFGGMEKLACFRILCRAKIQKVLSTLGQDKSMTTSSTDGFKQRFGDAWAFLQLDYGVLGAISAAGLLCLQLIRTQRS